MHTIMDTASRGVLHKVQSGLSQPFLLATLNKRQGHNVKLLYCKGISRGADTDSRSAIGPAVGQTSGNLGNEG